MMPRSAATLAIPDAPILLATQTYLEEGKRAVAQLMLVDQKKSCRLEKRALRVFRPKLKGKTWVQWPSTGKWLNYLPLLEQNKIFLDVFDERKPLCQQMAKQGIPAFDLSYD